MKAVDGELGINLNSLAASAGFPSDFDLALHGKSALEAFRCCRDMELLDRAIRANSKSLNQLAGGSSKCGAVLPTLDPVVMEALLGMPPLVFQEDFEYCQQHLKPISQAACNLLKTTPEGRKGRRAPAGLTFAIRELYTVFKDHFPEEVGYYREHSNEFGYSGKFFNLVRLMLAELGIVMTPHGLGTSIRRNLKDFIS